MTTKKGNDPYYTMVNEEVIIFNFGKKVESINYCFTTEDSCDDYLVYDGNINKRIIKAVIDYPDYNEKQHLCMKISSKKKDYVTCNDKYYLVDSNKPKITSLYNEVFLSDKDNLESLFKVESISGIKRFSCQFDNQNMSGDFKTVVCEAVGNNNLVSTISKEIYYKDSNNIEGKKVLFVGDSITEGIYDKNNGWAGRVGIANNMNWKNVGVSGATIADSSKHITKQLHDNKDEKYDYVIMQGGINDIYKKKTLGFISEGFELDDFDNETYAGGLEELFYYAKKYYGNSKLGFIITYQTPNSSWGARVQNRSEQAALTRKICQKWGISYLDLYDGIIFENGMVKSYSDILKVNDGTYFRNGDREEVHLSSEGYDLVSKYISVWIKTL